jgi:hypothetical protein
MGRCCAYVLRFAYSFERNRRYLRVIDRGIQNHLILRCAWGELQMTRPSLAPRAVMPPTTTFDEAISAACS